MASQLILHTIEIIYSSKPTPINLYLEMELKAPNYVKT